MSSSAAFPCRSEKWTGAERVVGGQPAPLGRASELGQAAHRPPASSGAAPPANWQLLWENVSCCWASTAAWDCITPTSAMQLEPFRRAGRAHVPAQSRPRKLAAAPPQRVNTVVQLRNCLMAAVSLSPVLCHPTGRQALYGGTWRWRWWCGLAVQGQPGLLPPSKSTSGAPTQGPWNG